MDFSDTTTVRNCYRQKNADMILELQSSRKYHWKKISVNWSDAGVMTAVWQIVPSSCIRDRKSAVADVSNAQLTADSRRPPSSAASWTDSTKYDAAMDVSPRLQRAAN